jgi:hypothetical protein
MIISVYYDYYYYFNSATPILRMATKHTLVCAACSTCSSNSIHFIFNGNATIALPVTTSKVSDIKSALLALADFNPDQNMYTNFDVTVVDSAGDYPICDSVSRTKEIIFYSDYGNMPFLTISEDTSSKITFSTNQGKGEKGISPCSNNGKCNYDTGIVIFVNSFKLANFSNSCCRLM